MIKILLHGDFDPSPDLSPRTVSADDVSPAIMTVPP